MPVDFNMIPLTNSTPHMMQLEDPNLGGTCGPPLPVGAATVVDCRSGGVLDLGTETVYVWVGNVELNLPTFCALSDVTPNVLTMTCWTPGDTAGEIAKPQTWTAKASTERRAYKSKEK